MSDDYLIGVDAYSTTDLALAAVLQLYYPIKDIYREDDKKVHFIIFSGKKLNSLVEKYWRGELRVDPRKYYDSLKTLKGMIYNR